MYRQQNQQSRPYSKLLKEKTGDLCGTMAKQKRDSDFTVQWILSSCQVNRGCFSSSIYVTLQVFSALKFSSLTNFILSDDGSVVDIAQSLLDERALAVRY